MASRYSLTTRWLSGANSSARLRCTSSAPSWPNSASALRLHELMWPSASNITMPSAVVSRMAPSSSALAWPTADGSGAGRAGADRGGDACAFQACASRAGAGEDQGQRGVVVPADRVEARVDRRRGSVFARGLRRGNRHRRAGVRCAAGARDAGLDIERVETAGLLQRMKARIADPLEGTPDWHRAAGRAGRSGRRRAADRAASCRAGSRRAPAARAASASRAVRRSARAFRLRPAARSTGSGAAAVSAAAGAPFSLSSRADNCRASSLKALFSTGVRTGALGSLDRPERQRRSSALPREFPQVFPNRFVVKSRDRPALAIQPRRRMQRYRDTAGGSAAGDEGSARSAAAADVDDGIRRRRRVEAFVMQEFVSAQRRRAAPGRRDRGRRRSPDSRQNSAPGRRSASPTIPPASGCRHRPASSG